jgi:hypothetical protein
MKKKAKRFQLKITIKGSKPLIWRRVIVDSNLLLEDLHLVIQTIMPWLDYHMHQFVCDKLYYGPSEDVDESYIDLIDYSGIKLSDLIDCEKDKMMYEYDFGDDWQHAIVIEKILPPTDSESRVEYVTGKNASPPEDCGGLPGYARMQEVLNDPSSDVYNEMRDWLGLEGDEQFDPTDVGFEADEINDDLCGI